MGLPKAKRPEKGDPMNIQAQAEAELKPFDGAREALEDAVQGLESNEAQAWTHSEAERYIEERGREVMRRLLEGFLASQGPGVAASPVVDQDGTKLEYRRLKDRRLMSIFGPVHVTRMGYYIPEASVRHPRDAELNLPKRSYSFETQRRNAIEVARGSFDDAVKALLRYTGANVPKRQAEELVVQAAKDFDFFYRQREFTVEAASGELLVITVDGKGVVVRKQDLREETRKAAEKRTRKLATKLAKGEKRNAKRMATVAAVYTVDRFQRAPEDVVGEIQRIRELNKQKRPRPQGKRVWASLVKGPEEVIADAFEEALRRDPERTKPWVVVVDGNKTQLRIIKQCARRYRVKVTIVVDLYHVMLYLWRAAHELTIEGTPDSERWVMERARRVLHGEAGLVAGAMRRSATKRGLAPDERLAIDDCADYLEEYRQFLNYDDALTQGYPIGSGVVEGACRYLINDRLDITGAHWSIDRAEAVLQVRALKGNGDFEEYWGVHETQEFLRNHAARYLGEPPATVRPSHRARLRLVK
jgi:hypothetical protein